jgi:hypothetical protein
MVSLPAETVNALLPALPASPAPHLQVSVRSNIVHSPLSPHRRPLTSHTLLGSPIRVRGLSIGTSSPFGNPNENVCHKMSPNLISDSMPPEPSVTQKAMDHAAASERERAKTLEQTEVDLSADELRHVLKQERYRMGRVAAEMAALRAAAVQSQFEAEVIEEGRINGLMRRLDILQQEKGRIIVELEREEEMVRAFWEIGRWDNFSHTSGSKVY